jgi:hypothetical protein
MTGLVGQLVFREMAPVYSQNRTEPIQRFCGQNAEVLNIKLSRSYSNDFALQG